MIEWRIFDDKKALVFLQQFCCAAPAEKWGRRSEPHRKPWEVEVQSHLRQLSRKFKPGDLVLVGREGDTVAAVAHLEPMQDERVVRMFIVAVAVSREYRGGDHRVADALMGRIQKLAVANALECRRQGAFLYGNIDFQNEPSQRMAARAGFEPVDGPGEDCQRWRMWLPVVPTPPSA